MGNKLVILKKSRKTVAAMLITAVGMCAAQAETIKKDALLLSEPYLDAATVLSIKAGTEIKVNQTRGGWARVTPKNNMASGWIRTSNIEGTSAVVADVAKCEGGREASNNTMATSGIRGACTNK